MFLSLLRSFNLQKFTSIETTSLNHFGVSNGHLSWSWRLMQPQNGLSSFRLTLIITRRTC